MAICRHACNGPGFLQENTRILAELTNIWTGFYEDPAISQRATSGDYVEIRRLCWITVVVVVVVAASIPDVRVSR